MNNRYFPIVRAKQGEIEALANLKASVLKRCTAVFEVTKLDGQDLERAQKRSDTPYEYYLRSRAEQIASIYKGRRAIVDISQWPLGITTEGGEQILSFLCNRLNELGVVACPIIGYDRWDSVEYREMIRTTKLSKRAYFCIRLDSIALEDLGDPEHFVGVMEDIISLVNLSEADTRILIDLGDVTRISMEDIVKHIEDAYSMVKSIGFEYVIMAGSSIPDSIEKAVKQPDSTGVVQRREVIAWKGFMDANPAASLYFGDYGIRNPRASDTIAPNMNVKIRYTIENSFFIARGHSVRKEHGYAQSQILSRIIVESPHFMEGFSWGDDKIEACGRGELIGNSTNWIAFDTNHHVSTVVAEVREFTAQLQTISERA